MKDLLNLRIIQYVVQGQSLPYFNLVNKNLTEIYAYFTAKSLNKFSILCKV